MPLMPHSGGSVAAEPLRCPRGSRSETRSRVRRRHVGVTYHIVEHDGGYAYKVGDVFSETFPSRDEALQAAQARRRRAAGAGLDRGIRYQDKAGQWHDETAQGNDRPVAKVEE